MKFYFCYGLIVTLGIATTPTLAAELNIPHEFSSGTPAVAAEVNENFASVKAAVNDNNNRIKANESQISELQAQNMALGETVAQLQFSNTQLEERIATLEGYVSQLQEVMHLQNDRQGNPSVVFSGVNVHINNGEGTTAEINGLGNLIVGYDEEFPHSQYFCSNGDYSDQQGCEADGYAWTNSHKSGSHNVVIGREHNYPSYGGLVSGRANTINGIESSAVGGSRNNSSGVTSFVSGGSNNRAAGPNSSVAGGNGNVATGSYSSIAGGKDNTANAVASTISGGELNTASGNYSAVCGGSLNSAIAQYSTVGGGIQRQASDIHDWVAGTLLEDH